MRSPVLSTLAGVFFLSSVAAAAACGGSNSSSQPDAGSQPDGAAPDATIPPPQPGPHIIFIDVDDHGLKALWSSNSPNMQMMARNGVLGYTRVDLPTHSNQNNITLLTGAWPEVTDVPHNSWLDRQANKQYNESGPYQQPFAPLGSNSALALGSYVYYDHNPLGSRVDSLYSDTKAGGMRSAYVGELPPFEHGADDITFTVIGSTIEGIPVNASLAGTLLGEMNYPMNVISTFHLDGPPMMGEALNQYTLRDAGKLFDAAAAGGPPPPQLLFCWDFLALDGDPTSSDGASGPAVQKIVEDIDKGLGDLMSSVKHAGYDKEMNYVITLDHGKVDTHNQVAFESQLATVIKNTGSSFNVTADNVKTLDEAGDVLIYAAVPNAGTAAGADAELTMAHNIYDMIAAAAKAGSFKGLALGRTITWDGYKHTRRFFDIRSTSPHNPDLVMFPADDWTLNDVNGTGKPGAITGIPAYGRHGGISADELYVPVIFYGPAFKSGKLVPVPIDHPDVAPTVAAAIGLPPPTTAEGGPVTAVLAKGGSGAELLNFPTDPTTTRPTALTTAGYKGSAPTLAGAPAKGAVVIDVSGLYQDNPSVATGVASLMQSGATMTFMHTRFRDWPETEYQQITGTYPSGTTWVPFAEDDPSQVAIGRGQFAMPPASNFVSDMTAYTAWHSGSDTYADQTVFTAAKGMGLETAVLGAPDYQLQHVATPGVDFTPQDGKTLDDVLSDAKTNANGRALIWYAASGGQDANAAATTAIQTVQTALQTAGLADQYVIVVTSRGGDAIDDKNTDAYGPGSARHVPLILVGPNIRAGVVLTGPVTPADIAPTVLYALGKAARAPDIAFGVQLDGGTAGDGTPLPMPTGDRTGHVILDAFTPPGGP